jgi:hypothetical protein
VRLARRALWLVGATLTYNIVEALVAVWNVACARVAGHLSPDPL